MFLEFIIDFIAALFGTMTALVEYLSGLNMSGVITSIRIGTPSTVACKSSLPAPTGGLRTIGNPACAKAYAICSSLKD